MQCASIPIHKYRVFFVEFLYLSEFGRPAPIAFSEVIRCHVIYTEMSRNLNFKFIYRGNNLLTSELGKKDYAGVNMLLSEILVQGKETVGFIYTV